jgi:hypothetical protein
VAAVAGESRVEAKERHGGGFAYSRTRYGGLVEVVSMQGEMDRRGREVRQLEEEEEAEWNGMEWDIELN